MRPTWSTLAVGSLALAVLALAGAPATPASPSGRATPVQTSHATPSNTVRDWY